MSASNTNQTEELKAWIEQLQKQVATLAAIVPERDALQKALEYEQQVNQGLIDELAKANETIVIFRDPDHQSKALAGCLLEMEGYVEENRTLKAKIAAMEKKR
jgi:hypothetical protein